MTAPTSDNARRQPGVEGKAAEHESGFDFATDERKAFATLQAHAALAGWALS